MTKTERSSFVDVVAWVFIVLSTASTGMSALQNVMIHVLFSGAEIRAAMASDPVSTRMPPLAGFLFRNIELIVASVFILSLALLMAAIGLLMRKNWARLVFMCLLALGIAWTLGGLVLQRAFQSQFAQPTDAPAEFQRQFQTLQTTLLLVSVVFAIGVSTVLGWIIWRLRSAAIVAEFRTPVGERAVG